MQKGGQRRVVMRSDVQVVNVGGGQKPPEPQRGGPPSGILHIIDAHGSTGLGGASFSLLA